MPLIFHWPDRIERGTISTQPAHLVDIAPTLTSLLGIEQSGHSGRDLSRYFSKGIDESRTAPDSQRSLLLQKPHHPSAPPEDPRSRQRLGLRSGQWKWIQGAVDHSDELYDLVADPWELTNVAHEPANVSVISEMRMLLADWMLDTEDYNPVPLPTSVGRGQKPDIDTGN